MDDRFQSRTTSGTGPGAPRKRLLLGLREALANWSGVHLKGFLDKLDQELFRLADCADNNADQSRYWQTRAELVSNRDLIERRMSDRLRDAFQAFIDRRDTWTAESGADSSPARGNPSPSETGSATGALELVEDEHLERSLAVDSMSRRAATDCAEALYALHQRLSVLAAGQKVTEQGNPVAPRIFAEAVDTGLMDLAIDNRARLLIYKLYEVQLMQRLNKLYELLNHQLKTEGVLPHLRHTVIKRNDPVPPGLAGSDPASQRNQQQLMERVRTLRAIPVTRTGAGATADTIEFVGLLFKYMLDDEQLPDAVKALLSSLHTPFLKVALSDPGFFNSPQHPARQLLNTLVAAGERWVEPEGRRKSEILQQMGRIVQRALDEFDGDAGLFSELSAEFTELLRQYAQRVGRAEQRACETARGEDRLQESRQQVEQFLNRRCAGLSLTAAARELLFGPWAHYQTFVWLRFGTDSNAWEESADAVDALIHYLGPGRQRNANHERLLLAGLRSGLDMVGYDRAKGEALLEALVQSRDSNTPVEPLRAVETPLPRAGTEDPELDKLVRLESGTWFLFGADLPRDQQERLKLAWHNGRTLSFMFVNRLGQQMAVKPGAELALELREGRTRILGHLNGKPFFEKALERIAEQLKGNAPALTESAP